MAVHEEQSQVLGATPGTDSPKMRERVALLQNFAAMLPAHVRTVYEQSGVGVAAALLGVRPFRLDLGGLQTTSEQDGEQVG